MRKLLGKLTVGSDGIWGDVDDYGEQEAEKTFVIPQQAKSIVTISTTFACTTASQ